MGKSILNLEHLKRFAQKHNIQCESTAYENQNTEYTWSDVDGHVWTESFRSIQLRAKRAHPLVFKQAKFLSYEEAKRQLEPYKLTSTAWKSFLSSDQLPEHIPRNPYSYYRQRGWVSWYDFLSYSRNAYLSFSDAKLIVLPLGLKNYKQWKEWVSSEQYDNSIPTSPWRVYKDQGWTCLQDFLGATSIQYKTYEQAEVYVRALNLASTKAWREFTKDDGFPVDLPKQPHQFYKNTGWSCYSQFLGLRSSREKSDEKKFRNYLEAQTYVTTLGIKTAREWFSYVQMNTLPDDIPRNPYHYYRGEGWVSWREFLTGNHSL